VVTPRPAETRLGADSAATIDGVFDHVTIRVADRAESDRFYDTVLTVLGVDTYSTPTVSAWGRFQLSAGDDLVAVTRRLHVGFTASTREMVDDFWRTGVAAGYRDDGPPGPRPQYREDYYGAFLLDPDGNSIEAVHHGATRERGAIDHLWIRVADLAAARRFYDVIAPSAGLRLAEDTGDRVRFAGRDGSFSLVPGEPTEHLHMAFATDDDGDVRSFHRAATEAGYRDHGRPGERRRYHPGYYAAYVLDPDGNNIEVVNHHRPAP
jgi:catechol 2,3-dioxygenase-like lactoylglutathione lyase family enzyme